MDPGGRNPGRAKERLSGEPIVALLVLRSHAALVGEPNLGRGQLRRRRGEEFVGADRGRSPAEREVRDAVFSPGRLERAGDVLGGSPGDRLGIDTTRQPGQGSIASAARSAGA